MPVSAELNSVGNITVTFSTVPGVDRHLSFILDRIAEGIEQCVLHGADETEVRQVISALMKPEPTNGMEWYPPDSAPTDGREILCLFQDGDRRRREVRFWKSTGNTGWAMRYKATGVINICLLTLIGWHPIPDGDAGIAE